jgi:hypothetical protein
VEKHPRKESPSGKEWTAEEKLRVLVEVSGITEEERGSYLRRNGLYEATLKQWREEALAGLSAKRAHSTDMEVTRAERQQLKKCKHCSAG